MSSKSYSIDKLDHFGRGIIEIGGKKVFVSNALLGDIVEILVIKDKKNYSIAEISSFIKKSPYRKTDYCNKCIECGGCDIGELIYQKQLEYKKLKTSEIVDKYLKEKIIINPIIYDKDINYRNKITLHVKGKKIGLYKKDSNEIVYIDYCYLVNDDINSIIKRVNKFIKNEKHNINKIVIKSTNLKENMIVFYGKVDKDIAIKYFDDITSIFINNDCIKNKFIKEKLSKYEFVLSKDSFFQVNRFNTINLYNEIVRLIKNKKIKNALDLYCGTGTISIFVSDYVDNITGIEECYDAIESANRNKVINNISNVNYICDSVENVIESFKNIDLIIVDPPRTGLSNKVINNIIKINPKYIVYVSCDAMTLMRDLNTLKDKYTIKELTPVDMFPNTYHCESVTVLERR